MFGNFKHRKKRSAWQCDLALHQAFEVAGNDTPAFQRLVLYVRQHTETLRILPVGGYVAWGPAQTFVDGLLSLSAHHRSWRRDVDTWEPTNGSAWLQFASLANHLFGDRPVPAFMTSAWFEGRSADARRHQKWFKHLSLGYGIRGVATPIQMTKLMERHFVQAPHQCSVNQAIRWSQVRGLGGDTALAKAIVATALGQQFEHEEYWSLVIRFLIDNPDLGIANIGSVIEYLHLNRQLCRLKPSSKRSKRKAAEEFLSRVQHWRSQPPLLKTSASLGWKRSDIGEFEYDDDRRAWSPSVWKVRELLDSNELLDEGRAMRHCVGSYGRRCASGISTIWSLTCSDSQSQCRRELTIEVNPKNRKIVQAKGRRNSVPTVEARRIMLLWASEEGLEVAGYV
jgi:hypothetical protein